MTIHENLVTELMRTLEINNIKKAQKYLGDGVYYGLAKICGRDIIMIEPVYDTKKSIIIFNNGNAECITEGVHVDQMMLVEVLLDIAGMQ